ncbi:methylesterase 3 [Manihot esculenta]|uniref:(S)-hydroxynitrile lyase n=1 Tax=Manihot esculenta TaxID=3983 RepID=A0A2C9UV10_MANES|nr:methylesterase 3 [Manihot esculenta]
MEDRQRHFVLVHGACHGAWSWYKVATLLKSANHKVTALDLAASGVHPKQLTDLHSFSDYYEPLMEFMKSLPPEERVILVGHSMGGLSISAAMERFPEKISAAVFATAFMPGPDFSYNSIREEVDRQLDSFMDTQFTFANGQNNPPTSMLFGPDILSTRLYQLSPSEDLILATLTMRPFPLHDDGSQNLMLTKDKYGSVTRIYVVCGQDKIINEDVQRWMIQNNPTDEVKIIADSDHMVMFSKSQELCSCLLEIARKYL